MQLGEMMKKKEYINISKASEGGYNGPMRGVLLFISGRVVAGWKGIKIDEPFPMNNDTYKISLISNPTKKFLIFKNGEIISRKDYENLYYKWRKKEQNALWWIRIFSWIS